MGSFTAGRNAPVAPLRHVLAVNPFSCEDVAVRVIHLAITVENVRLAYSKAYATPRRTGMSITMSGEDRRTGFESGPYIFPILRIYVESAKYGHIMLRNAGVMGFAGVFLMS